MPHEQEDTKREISCAPTLLSPPAPLPAWQAMLSDYASNPATNWKSKDTAIYLVLALTVQGKTGGGGGAGRGGQPTCRCRPA